jgi:hypothetical protein
MVKEVYREEREYHFLTTLVPAPSAGRDHTCACEVTAPFSCGTVQAECTEKNKEKTLCSSRSTQSASALRGE